MHSLLGFFPLSSFDVCWFVQIFRLGGMLVAFVSSIIRTDARPFAYPDASFAAFVPPPPFPCFSPFRTSVFKIVRIVHAPPVFPFATIHKSIRLSLIFCAAAVRRIHHVRSPGGSPQTKHLTVKASGTGLVDFCKLTLMNGVQFSQHLNGTQKGFKAIGIHVNLE